MGTRPERLNKTTLRAKNSLGRQALWEGQNILTTIYYNIISHNKRYYTDSACVRACSNQPVAIRIGVRTDCRLRACVRRPASERFGRKVSWLERKYLPPRWWESRDVDRVSPRTYNIFIIYYIIINYYTLFYYYGTSTFGAMLLLLLHCLLLLLCVIGHYELPFHPLRWVRTRLHIFFWSICNVPTEHVVRWMATTSNNWKYVVFYFSEFIACPMGLREHIVSLK